MNKRAIILAAGRGSRMGHETNLKPKCLTLLAGKTLLYWQTSALKTVGIQKVLVVRGYRADMLQGDFKTVDNKRWSETNMVSSLFCVPISDGDSIISYSDIAYHPSHIDKLLNAKGDIVITADIYWEELWRSRMENPLDDAETFKTREGRLYEIGKKTSDVKDIEAQYMGLLKLSQKGWQTMFTLYQSFSKDNQDKMDMTTILNELLKRQEEINVVFVEGRWCEADQYSDIIAYEKEIKNSNNWRHDWR